MPPPPLNLSLYLVTSSVLLPPRVSLESQIFSAIQNGGATIIQLREKSLPTRLFIQNAKLIHVLTKSKNIPLLINDRVDVALAVGCEGVHLGQDDMSYRAARRLLGGDKYIGVSVSSGEHGRRALEDIYGWEEERVGMGNGVGSVRMAYLGIGPVWATDTKPDHNPPIGPAGLAEILKELERFRKERYPRMPQVGVVAIGGINGGNVDEVMEICYGDESAGKEQQQMMRLDGVAVVSAIMASTTPEEAARELRRKVEGHKGRGDTNIPPLPPLPPLESDRLISIFNTYLTAIPTHSPVIHHITNSVVKDFSANITLAIGASPIMSENAQEFLDLVKVTSGLVVNMGTCSPEFFEIMTVAVNQNNDRGNPVVFDPVGAGATGWRRELSRRAVLRDEEWGGWFDVVKGNRGEVLAVAGVEGGMMRGVDSVEDGEVAAKDVAKVVRDFARREECIVVMTGKTDIISNGTKTYLVHNGHPIQAKVTGTGCSLSSIIASSLAVARIIHDPLSFSQQDALDEDEWKLNAVLAAVVGYNICAERAARKDGVLGPGRWRWEFLDELSKLVGGGRDGIRRGEGRVEVVEVE